MQMKVLSRILRGGKSLSSHFKSTYKSTLRAFGPANNDLINFTLDMSLNLVHYANPGMKKLII